MWFPTLKWIYRAWRYRLVNERDEIAFVRNHLVPGDVALDIGAHKGAFTYWMAKQVGPRGRVFSFEPQPLLASRLTRLVKGQSLAHVTVENLALSSQVGVATLSVPGGKPSPGATLEPRNVNACEQTSVPVLTLDSYFADRQISSIKLLKCDVEGHELEVFRGGEQLLRHHKPLLLFECEARHRQDGRLDEVFRFLTELGYRGEFFRHGKLTSLQQFDPVIHQADPASDSYAGNFVFTATA